MLAQGEVCQLRIYITDYTVCSLFPNSTKGFANRK